VKEIYMNYIILDTSAIIFGLSNGVDVFNALHDQMPERRIMISTGILKELNRISEGMGRFSKFAKVAINLLERYPDIKVVKDGTYVDKWIAQTAAAPGYVVCSNDSKLKRELKTKGISVFSMTRSGIIR
jgi:rRNA-processing protein FCF1